MSIVEKLKKRTYAWMKDFEMIVNWDKVMIAVSWGKDSLAMLDILTQIKKHSDLDFEIVAVYVIPQIPWIKVLSDKLEEIFKSYEIDYIIKEMNIPTNSELKKWIEDANTCQWCSYTRRICLMKLAEEIKATKIAYWHHMDDIVDTLFLNISVGRRMDIMLPFNPMKKWDLAIIRPMTYLREDDIIKYCNVKWIVPLSADCIVSNKSNREKIRDVVDNLEIQLPWFIENTFHAYISKFWAKN